jgi:hypothetical protein
MLETWIEHAFISDPEQWLFPSERHTPLTRDNLWRRQLQPKLTKVGLLVGDVPVYAPHVREL